MNKRFKDRKKSSPKRDLTSPKSNTGGWEKLYTGWAPGARAKYSPDWSTGYNTGEGK